MTCCLASSGGSTLISRQKGEGGIDQKASAVNVVIITYLGVSVWLPELRNAEGFLARGGVYPATMETLCRGRRVEFLQSHDWSAPLARQLGWRFISPDALRAARVAARLISH